MHNRIDYEDVQQADCSEHEVKLMGCAYREMVALRRRDLDKLESFLWGAGIAVTLTLGFLRPHAVVLIALACMAISAVIYTRRKKKLLSQEASLLRQLPSNVAVDLMLNEPRPHVHYQHSDM